MVRLLYIMTATVIGASCWTPAHAIDFAQWSDKDVQDEIEAAFSFSIFDPVVSLQRHALACNDLPLAAAAEARLAALAARVPVSMPLTMSKLKAKQDIAGVRGTPSSTAGPCERSALADRKSTASEVLDRLDAIISEWERRQR